MAQSSQEERVGFLTPLLGAILSVMTIPSSWIVGSRVAHSDSNPTIQEAQRRAVRVDLFVTCCLVTGVSFYAIVASTDHLLVKQLATAFALWRIMDAVATTVRVTLFDHLHLPPDREFRIASRERLIVLGLINFVELIFTFGTIYAANLDQVRMKINPDFWDPLYFSAITQLTVGYGDLHPTGWIRGVAVLQGFAGPVLIGLLIARFLSMLSPVKSFDR